VRILLLDVGNSRIKWGVSNDDGISRTGALTHESLKERGIEALTRKLPRGVEAAVACNVAGPEFGRRLARAIGIHIGGDLRFVHSERQGFGVINAYKRPRSLGVDRWVAMIGARAGSNSALCVVDAGTALTIDALDKSGRHLGGQILPGIRLIGRALETDTSDIGPARRRSAVFESAEDFFADRTQLAVAAGAVNALCGAVDRAAKLMRELGHRPKVVLTGGDASRILAGLGGRPEHRPNLVLEGLAHMMRSAH